MLTCPYVLCDMQGCEYHTQPILLPLSNPPKTDPHQLLWPANEWKAYLACPGCGQLLLRSARDVRQRPLSTKDQALLKNKHWFLLASKCEVKDCGTPMQLSVLDNANDAPVHVMRAIVEKAAIGHIVGNMACGHTFHVPEDARLEWIPDAIPGYDPQKY